MPTKTVAKRRKRAKSPRCPCPCRQSSRLRKVECAGCGNVAWQSRPQIERGLMECPCGFEMRPACLLDRAAAGDVEAGREFDHRYPSRPDPQLSAWAKKGAKTRAWHKVRDAIPAATAESCRVADDMPF